MGNPAKPSRSTLFGALSQKAFKGELDLSRVPLAKSGMEAGKTQYAATIDQEEADSVLTADFLNEFERPERIPPPELRHRFDDFLSKHIGVFCEDSFWQEAVRQMSDSMNDKDENGKPPPLYLRIKLSS